MLKGRTALVTGSAKRIGREIALELARQGANVVVHTHTSRDEAEATARDVASLGVQTLVVAADQSSEAEVDAACEQALTRFGKVDILVCNASTWDRRPFAETSTEDFDAALRVNLRGPWLWATKLGRQMQDWGSIVFIGDAACDRPSPEAIAYSIAKTGLRTMAVGLAKALAPHVRVGVVEPGPVLFPPEYPEDKKPAFLKATLTGRLTPASEIARAVAFLAASEHMTGVVLPVDGGYRFGV